METREKDMMDDSTHVSPLLKTPAAAKVLDVKPRTLEEWRSRGGGPPFVRLSATCVRYELDKLKEWISERTACSTAEEAARRVAAGGTASGASTELGS